MNKKTKRLSYLSLFIAIEIVIATLPFLGFIPLGFINVTTLHIPVIIAGILLGKKDGAIVGFTFGLLSLIKNTIAPVATSFLFSPFYEIGGISGNYKSLIISFIPRILIGYLSGLCYSFLVNKTKKEDIAIGVAACIGSLANTVLVMGFAYLFFAHEYAQAIHVAYDTIFYFMLGVIATNGIAEAIAGVLISIAVCKIASKIIRR